MWMIQSNKVRAMVWRSFPWMVSLVLVGRAFPCIALEKAAEAERLFESKIRPLLIDRCFKCHAEAKAKGGLRLDSIVFLFVN